MFLNYREEKEELEAREIDLDFDGEYLIKKILKKLSNKKKNPIKEK